MEFNEILKQIVQEKRNEKRIADQMQKIYNPEIKQDVDFQIMKHKKEIRKLQQQKINPEMEKRKKARLRKAVLRSMRAGKLSQNQTDMFSQQESFTDMGGKQSFGY